MNDKSKERVSALVDGELETRSTSETVDVLLESSELQLDWLRYHVVRDVLRHKVYPDAPADLCQRVRKCVADEPLHFPARRRLPARWRDTLKPVAGIALAASVALVAIVAVRSPGQLPDHPPTASAPTARAPSTQVATNPLPAIVPASAITDAEVRPAALRRLHWNTDEPAVANRLNGYLVNHSEHLGGPIGGLHPYARIVGYDAVDRR